MRQHDVAEPAVNNPVTPTDPKEMDLHIEDASKKASGQEPFVSVGSTQVPPPASSVAVASRPFQACHRPPLPFAGTFVSFAGKDLAATLVCPFLRQNQVALPIGVKGTQKQDSAGKRKPLKPAEEDVLVTIEEAVFLKFSWAREILFWSLGIFLTPFWFLVCYWLPGLRISVRYDQVPQTSLEADYVCCRALDKSMTVETVMVAVPSGRNTKWVPARSMRRALLLGGSVYSKYSGTLQSAGFTDSSKLPVPRMFEWRREKFWFDEHEQTWVRKLFDVNRPPNRVHEVAALQAWASWSGSALGSSAEQSPLLPDLGTFSEAFDTVRRLTYGQNEIDIVPPAFVWILLEEIVRPFFIFQIFSFGVWLEQEYYNYCGPIISLTVVSLLYTTAQAYYFNIKLQKLARSECMVTKLTLSNGGSSGRPSCPLPTFVRTQVISNTLLPGDLVELTTDLTLPCDLVLLSGSAVINEAMLTGESAPVLKSAIPYMATLQDDPEPSSWFSPGSDRDAKFILFGGTKVLQAKPQGSSSCEPLWDEKALQGKPWASSPASIWQLAKPEALKALERSLVLQGTDPGDVRSSLEQYSASFKVRESPLPVIAMVTRTGFGTSKGQMVRSILYPKPSKFDFNVQTMKFLLILILATAAGVIATVVFCAQQEFDTKETVLRCLNIITCAIPPALPLALSIAITTTLAQLQRKNIFCISQTRIIPAGRVNVCCFDKTGTLTQDGLILQGVRMLGWGADQLCCTDLESELRLLCVQASSNKQAYSLFQEPSAAPSGLIASTRLAMVHTLAACHSLAVLEDDDEIERVVAVRKTLRDKTVRASKQRTSTASRRTTLVRKTESKADLKLSEHLDQTLHFIGDPLEVQMFANTGWEYRPRPMHLTDASRHNLWHDPLVPTSVDTIFYPPDVATSSCSLAVVRRLDFDSSLRLMSTIVMHQELDASRSKPAPHSNSDLHFSVLVKGAPESVKVRCMAGSLPPDFDSALTELASQGFRILGCAFRPVTASVPEGCTEAERVRIAHEMCQSLLVAPRDELEKDLYFTGLLVMENPLKTETPAVLEELIRAGLRCVMVTGDNPLTATAVGKQCGPFFVRPSRQTLLLDAQGSAGPSSTLAKVVVRDIMDTSRFVDADVFFGRCPGAAGTILSQNVDSVQEAAVIGGPGWKPASAEEQATIQAMLPDPKKEIDLVVSGPAFSALVARHEEYQDKKISPSITKDQLAKITSRTSKALEVLPVTPLQLVLSQANVFARMSPVNKQDLMYRMQDMGYVVSMTGDGANDSGALKAADVGLSIQAKPAVASEDAQAAAAPTIAAPFSTSLAHIGALVTLLTEGRACLVSSFALFRFMYCYGIIQFTAVLVLYRDGFELGDNQYLWMDLGMVMPFSVVMPMIRARSNLTKGRPESDLLSLGVIRSVVGLAAILVAFQLGANALLHSDPSWVVPTDEEKESEEYDTTITMDVTQVGTFCNFQYVAVAFAVSQSFGMFREAMCWQYPLLVVLIYAFIMNSFLMLDPSEGMIEAFGFVPMDKEMAWKQWVMALGCSVCFILYERFFVPHMSRDGDTADPEQILKEMDPNREVSPEDQARLALYSKKPDYQPTILPKPQWSSPRYEIIEEVTNPVWSALTRQ